MKNNKNNIRNLGYERGIKLSKTREFRDYEFLTPKQRKTFLAGVKEGIHSMKVKKTGKR